MYRIAICDDDKIICSQIEDFLQEYIDSEVITVDKYYDVESFYLALKNDKSFNLVFLDILFGPPKGISVGRKIREELLNENIHIVYISGAEQYAIKLFESRPFDFLVKPFGKSEVIKVVEKSIKLTDLYNQSFEFQYEKIHYSILYSEIIYFESNARKISIHTSSEVYEFYGKIDTLQQEVKGKFYRIHQSYLINPTYIQQFLKVFFDIKGSKLQISMRYFVFIMYFIVNSLGFMLLQWSATVTLISNIIGAFIITLTYSGKWKYRILSPVIVTALNLLCEDMIFRLLLSMNVENIVVVGIALTNLLLLMIVLLLQKLSDIQHGEDISLAEFTGIIAVPLISGIISIITLSDCENEMAMTVGGLGLLVLNVIVFYLLERLTRMYKKQTVMTALEGQNKAYEKQLQIVRQSEENAAAVRHDMKNHITVLHYMAEKDGNKDISSYLEKMNSYFKNGERFICTGDHLIDGLINMKLSEAAYKLDTEVIHEVSIECTDNLDKMDFSIVISNLLDNALDALKVCDFKRKLYVAIEEKNGLLFIKVHNTYEGTIMLKKGNIVTTKDNKKEHGIGLKNVKKIVDKYNGEINIDYGGNIFKVEIIMYLNSLK